MAKAATPARRPKARAGAEIIQDMKGWLSEMASANGLKGRAFNTAKSKFEALADEVGKTLASSQRQITRLTRAAAGPAMAVAGNAGGTGAAMASSGAGTKAAPKRTAGAAQASRRKGKAAAASSPRTSASRAAPASTARGGKAAKASTKEGGNRSTATAKPRRKAAGLGGGTTGAAASDQQVGSTGDEGAAGQQLG
jgi:hypothetical protein